MGRKKQLTPAEEFQILVKKKVLEMGLDLEIAPRYSNWERRLEHSEENVPHALYLRVSDDKKKNDGERRQDIFRQIKIFAEYFSRNNIKKVKIYADDGKSAWSEDLNQRPDFKELLNHCRGNWIKYIYIEDMTRFSRNLSLGLQWFKELGEKGIQVISLKEGEIEVTSSKGWMQSAMLLMFSEWDSRIKSEKVKSGMNKARNLGKHVGRPKTKIL